MSSNYALPLIFVLFFSALLSLAFSGLSLTKAISLQNEASVIFFQEIQSKEVFSGIVSSMLFIFQNAVLPLLPFLLLSLFGFLSVLYFKPETKYLLTVLIAVLGAGILVKPSLVLAIISLGFFPSLLLLKNLEERKTIFKTSSSFISSCLRYLNISIALAVFFGILLIPDFQNLAEEDILSALEGILPRDLQQAQKDLLENLVEQNILFAKAAVNNEYNKLTPEEQVQCEGFRKNIQTSMDNYKAQALEQMESALPQQQELPSEMVSQIGILSIFTKTIPLTAAIAIFFLLELLKPLFVLFSGILYSVLRKHK